MDNEAFYNILSQVENKSDLKAEDIPSLDLYMDQIMTLFDVNLADNKRYPDDKLLTKTMINNYSKEGILKSIKGKKYSKDHILQMILIYSLKNTISIQEIKKVLQPYHEEAEKIEPLYNQFLETKKQFSSQLTNQLGQYIEENHYDLNDFDNYTQTLLLICALSTQLKSIAEKMLDIYHIEESK